MNSFISWIGGKKLLRKYILKEFPLDFSRYIEVFGGAGWVLFSKEKHAEIEVYNDVNGELVNLFRCVKFHPEALQKDLEYLLTSREMFLEAKEQIKIRGLTDIQRAARFFILIKESFGADCRSFSVRARDIKNAINFLTKASDRLGKVVIESLDFEHLIKTYDSCDALFYADPPYYNAEKYYPDKFYPEDHIRLFHTLSKIKGRFILSYNDCQQIRNLYQKFNIVNIERQNNLSNRKSRYSELIIKNF